jgi:DNA invertase Pin-like site-specific DNA recombinase
MAFTQAGGWNLVTSMDLASASVTARAPSPAAQYVRMSTEHQQYSPENQLEIIRQYAGAHNMEIVQEYSDHGRSGLNIAARDGLNQLMADVEAKRTNFTSLLVYDVSRWRRFQDVDESAYYEYVLRGAGIRVHYCAEQFENDGSMSSSVLKTLKRSMAAEYSRELSVKVFSGQCRLTLSSDFGRVAPPAMDFGAS